MGGALIAALAMIAYAFLRPRGEIPKIEERKRATFEPDRRIAEGQIVSSSSTRRYRKRRARVCFGAGARPLADMRPPPSRFYSYFDFRRQLSHRAGHHRTRSQVRLERLVAASPQHQVRRSNPSDSILVADDWSGPALIALPLADRLFCVLLSVGALSFFMPLPGGPGSIP